MGKIVVEEYWDNLDMEQGRGNECKKSRVGKVVSDESKCLVGHWSNVCFWKAV